MAPIAHYGFGMPPMMGHGHKGGKGGRGGGKGGRGDGKFHGDMDDYYLGEGMRGRQAGKDGKGSSAKDGKGGSKGKRGKAEKGKMRGKGKGHSNEWAGGASQQVAKNDYCQHFVNCGERPQNSVRDTGLDKRFEEYPKLRELIELKDEMTKKRTTPPMWFPCDLKTFDLSSLPCKFDVILVDPPWHEYQRRLVTSDNIDMWTKEEIYSMKIEEIADTPSFIFLWVGSMEGLNEGRAMLKKWGYRRCEDIVWVKTDHNSEKDGCMVDDATSVLVHTTEHCLMGIRGTVRRSVDGHFIHANVDTDVIITDELPGTRKPEELYHIIEHFCLGRRRLELFGEDHNLRDGWLTLGRDLSTTNFDPEKFILPFEEKDGHLVGCTPEIEQLRPKSPPPRGGDKGKK